MIGFYIAAIVAIVCTVMVISRFSIIHALLNLVVSFLAVAVIFFTLGAPFAAALEKFYGGERNARMAARLLLVALRSGRPHSHDHSGIRGQLYRFLANGKPNRRAGRHHTG